MLSSGVFCSPEGYPSELKSRRKHHCHGALSRSRALFIPRKKTYKFRCQISDGMSQKSNDTFMQRLTHFSTLLKAPFSNALPDFSDGVSLRRGRPRRSYQHLRERRISGKADRQIDFSSAVTPEEFSTVPSRGIVLLGTSYEYRVTSYATLMHKQDHSVPHSTWFTS